jgi:hypothetical protein
MHHFILFVGCTLHSPGGAVWYLAQLLQLSCGTLVTHHSDYYSMFVTNDVIHTRNAPTSHQSINQSMYRLCCNVHCESDCVMSATDHLSYTTKTLLPPLPTTKTLEQNADVACVFRVSWPPWFWVVFLQYTMARRTWHSKQYRSPCPSSSLFNRNYITKYCTV